MIKGLIEVIKWLGIYKAGVIATRIATTALSTATFTATGALKAFRIALAKTGIGLVVVALGELAAKFLLVKDNAGGAADETERYADAQERLKDRAEKFNEIISKQLGTTLKQSQQNVIQLNKEIQQRQRLIDIQEDSKFLTIYTPQEIAQFKEEIKRLEKKIKLEKTNQKVIKKGIQDKTIAQNSLIVAQEKELAIAQKMPD